MKNREQTIRILKVGFPFIVGQLLSMSMSTVDTIMAGNLSAKDLAAVAMGSSLYVPILLFFGGIIFSLTPLMAFQHGAENNKEIGKILRQALWPAVPIIILAFIFCRNSHLLCSLFNADKDLIPLVKGYLNAVSFGLPAIILYFIFKSPFEAISKISHVTFWSFIGLLFNILGNYTLVYGKFGFPEMGAVGTGYATAITNWVMFAGILFTAFNTKDIKKLQLFKKIEMPDNIKIFEILRIGLPISTSITMEVLLFSMVALLASMFGTTQLASNQVAFNITGMTFMVPLGLSFALTTLIGNAYGKGDMELVKTLAYTGNIISTLFMSCSALTIFIFRYELAGFYTNNSEVLNLTAELLVFGTAFQIFDGIQISNIGNLRGIQDTKVPMYTNLFCYWVLGFGTSYLIAVHFNYGVKGLWVGIILGLIGSAILHSLRFYKLTHKKRA